MELVALGIGFILGMTFGMTIIVCQQDIPYYIARIKNIFWRCGAMGCQNRMETEWVGGTQTWWECYSHSQERREKGPYFERF